MAHATREELPKEITVATFLRWLGSGGAWIRSLQYELPAVHEATLRPELRQWCALAGGLALILSRARPEDLESDYRTARAVYQQVRKCLQAGQAPRIASKLLTTLAGEIEAVADPLTKAACRACMRRPRRPDQLSPSEEALARAAESTRGGVAPPDAADFDDHQTQLSPEVFSQRSRALRRVVAGARNKP